MSASLASNYGTKGLFDTPSARVYNDGTFATGMTQDAFLESYMLTYQAFPWLQATYRYNGFKNLPNQNWDRNYEVKATIFRESRWVPEVAVGIRDLVGTGVFGAEYLVATKQYDNWDVTLGLGWGNLAGDGQFSNPLGFVSERFDSRTRSGPQGGTLQVDTFFAGKDVSLFGGIEYTFENYPIKAVVEYNPNPYVTGQSGYDNTASKHPVTWGLKWDMTDDVTVGIAYRHLQTLGLSIQARLDTTAPATKGNTPRFISSLDTKQSGFPEGLDKNSWYDRFLFDIERANLLVMSAQLYPTEKRAVLEIGNVSYPYWPDAIDEAHKLASIHLPKNIQTIDYIVNVDGHKVQTIRLTRDTFGLINPVSMKTGADILSGRTLTQPLHKTNFFTKHMHFDVTLSNRLMLFDPDQPLSFQFYAKIASVVNLPNDWKAIAAYRYNLYNNFGSLRRYSNSALPPVRTDVLRYLQEGEDGIESLYVDKRGSFSLMPTLHYRMYAGVLETMYSGVGGELLFQPNQSRLAFGISGNAVKKRAFDGGLDHLDYQTTTAFASLFWASPFHNYDMAVHVGRYLAKDVGATVQVRRTFNNGWQIGLWATKTNVSAEDFGEGSFDKGFFFRVPLHTITGSRVKSHYQTRLRPIQRDGGARLEDHTGNLWWDLRDARYDVFSRAGGR